MSSHIRGKTLKTWKITGIQKSRPEIPFILFVHKIKSICPEIQKNVKSLISSLCKSHPWLPTSAPSTTTTNLRSRCGGAVLQEGSNTLSHSSFNHCSGVCFRNHCYQPNTGHKWWRWTQHDYLEQEIKRGWKSATKPQTMCPFTRRSWR